MCVLCACVCVCVCKYAYSRARCECVCNVHACPCAREEARMPISHTLQCQHSSPLATRCSNLRRVNDSGKALDAKHAQVGDGEGSALELVRLELALPCPSRQVQHLGSDGTQALREGGEEGQSEVQSSTRLTIKALRHSLHCSRCSHCSCVHTAWTIPQSCSVYCT